jgi:hypothetical protein
MAFRQVELTEEELRAGSRAYKKFTAIGDKITAFFIGWETQEKDFKQGKGVESVDVLVFWNRQDGEFEITPPDSLTKAINKAMRAESDGGVSLRERAGHVVKMMFKATRDTGQPNPAKIIAIEVDTTPTIPAGFVFPRGVKDAAPQWKEEGRQGVGLPPPPASDDDIPF